MIIGHYDRVKKIHAEQQQILDGVRSNPRQAKPRGINDELLDNLARSSLIPIEDVRAIADWSVIILKDKSNEEKSQNPT